MYEHRNKNSNFDCGIEDMFASVSANEQLNVKPSPVQFKISPSAVTLAQVVTSIN